MYPALFVLYTETTMPPRAIHPEDKLRKREIILDAAQYLWTTQTDRLSNMDSLAHQAGVAKGTLYLYFRSKEEVLLALHERDISSFFDRLIERADQPEPILVKEFVELVVNEIHSSATFMPLASLCLGLMERHIPVEVAVAFKLRISEHMNRVVFALKQHFPSMSCDIMLQCYALMLGLWQLIKQNPVYQHLLTQGIELHCQMPANEEQFLFFLKNSFLLLLTGLLTQSTTDSTL